MITFAAVVTSFLVSVLIMNKVFNANLKEFIKTVSLVKQLWKELRK
jgi:hypothetical protein